MHVLQVPPAGISCILPRIRLHLHLQLPHLLGVAVVVDRLEDDCVDMVHQLGPRGRLTLVQTAGSCQHIQDNSFQLLKKIK